MNATIFQTIVSVTELVRHLEEPSWVIVDCRFSLAEPERGRHDYEQGHVPGAVYAHLNQDLSSPVIPGKTGRHPLPDIDSFARKLSAWGSASGVQVIVYDDSGGAMAARLWWMLRWRGHDAVAVLDGGLAKWLEEEREVTAEVPSFPATDYVARLRPEMNADVDFVERRLGAEDMLLLDARAPARYLGEAEPIDPVAGRIPGARNRFNAENLTPEGTFKTPEALKQELGALLGERDPAEVVHYCGSGVAACHNLLAMEVAGLPGSRIYAGSWSEWIADSRRPQAKGPA